MPGKQLNLLKSLPTVIRDPKLLLDRRKVKARGDDAISRLYGYDYFDGSRAYGYGGYVYDERWVSIAKDMISHYKLPLGAKTLDIGCAKGYLVYDLFNQGIEAYGIDVSRYAAKCCPTDIIGRIHRGDILDLPFPDDSFDFVSCINVIHNLDQKYVYLAFQEINRVCRKHCFITVDAYRTEEEKKILEDWVLTAKTYGTPSFWLDIFEQYNYTGDYDWCIWSSGYE